jgi:GTP cyclohydrolase I
MTSRDEKAAKISKAVADFLDAIGKPIEKNPELSETPINAASMWLDEIIDGYESDPNAILTGGSEMSGESDLVMVRDIFFHSTCPHHLLPYHGRAHVAYIPNDRIVGLSKIAKLVECFAHRLILQEEIGSLVAKALVEHLGAKGAACMLDVEQFCMVIRGVRQHGSRSVTVSYAGTMATDKAEKSNFLTAVNAKP